MRFMNAKVYSMMDELSLRMDELRRRERPSTPSPDLSVLQPLIDAVEIIMAKVAALWEELVIAIREAAAVLVPHICRLGESFGRWRLYKKLKGVIGKRAAWYVAERCPAWLVWRLT
jgi:hypothetical protein